MSNPFPLSLFAILTLTTGVARSQEAAKTPDAPAAAPAAEVAVKLDFTDAEAGDLPADLMVTDGEARFSIVEDGGNKVLQMSPSPIVDGGVLVGKSIKGGAMVSARIKATAKRRSFPKFGIGLHGVSGYRLLAMPSQKELILMKDEAVVTSVPLEWKTGTWTHLEFSITASADGGSAIEGRLWEEGQPRPAAAQITAAAKTPPGTGKASVWAAPYSELPVDFDDIIITAKP